MFFLSADASSSSVWLLERQNNREQHRLVGSVEMRLNSLRWRIRALVSILADKTFLTADDAPQKSRGTPNKDVLPTTGVFSFVLVCTCRNNRLVFVRRGRRTVWRGRDATFFGRFGNVSRQMLRESDGGQTFIGTHQEKKSQMHRSVNHLKKCHWRRTSHESRQQSQREESGSSERRSVTFTWLSDWTEARQD